MFVEVVRFMFWSESPEKWKQILVIGIIFVTNQAGKINQLRLEIFVVYESTVS